MEIFTFLFLREDAFSKAEGIIMIQFKNNSFREDNFFPNTAWMLVNEHQKPKSITSLPQSLQLVWCQTSLGHWVEQNHSRVTSDRQIAPDKGAHGGV